jgi:hypothetical protein
MGATKVSSRKIASGDQRQRAQSLAGLGGAQFALELLRVGFGQGHGGSGAGGDGGHVSVSGGQRNKACDPACDGAGSWCG